ncbi:hypothetical protein [Enterococcus faecalis]|uniref:hypothetical protein n=1 Tax=Enterococcus faecalis TaxID=1351 RepID=UPI002224E9E2|nr:hypothetical protein [Enterococcus faecalis]UYY35984.1 hypothetical protein OLL95_00565 [Enterococcus faecalis]UYY38800.1 hypothetical protein OLL92_00560 [Enterococcus faecalis]
MEIRGEFIDTAFQFSSAWPEELQDYVEDRQIYNTPSLLFYEETYIDQCNNFSKIIDKFKKKVFDNNLKIYKNNKIEKVLDYSKDVLQFSNVIRENNINGLQKEKLGISIQHFTNYEQTDKVKFIQSIYILLFLSNITNYKNNIFNFKVRCDDKEFKMDINYCDIKVWNLYDTYLWIIKNEDNIQTRLKIIRQLIIRKKSFDLSNRDLCSADSAFNRIIKEETDKYFSQVNLLKDDFLKLSKEKQESYQALHLKFLGWCSAVALYIYDELKSVDGDNLWKKILFSKSEKSLLILLIFILSLIVIWLLFIKETSELKSEYEKLKDLYIKQLYFDKKDFSNHIKEPGIPKLYQSIFYTFLGILALRFFVFFL